MPDGFKITGAVATTGRAVYGKCHATLHGLFRKDNAQYRAPCSFCSTPHQRKCDFIVGVYVENGVRKAQKCNKIMCLGCTSAYQHIDKRNVTDFCPEHDVIMLERFAGKR